MHGGGGESARARDQALLRPRLRRFGIKDAGFNFLLLSITTRCSASPADVVELGDHDRPVADAFLIPSSARSPTTGARGSAAATRSCMRPHFLRALLFSALEPAAPAGEPAVRLPRGAGDPRAHRDRGLRDPEYGTRARAQPRLRRPHLADGLSLSVSDPGQRRDRRRRARLPHESHGGAADRHPQQERLLRLQRDGRGPDPGQHPGVCLRDTRADFRSCGSCRRAGIRRSPRLPARCSSRSPTGPSSS